jgi:glycosyltransferase involved in cell wall biosynthesis
MKNSISIAIPTYNGDVLLDTCLRSLANEYFHENYKDIIIVSNGPKTNAEEILRKYEFPIVTRYIHINEASVSMARNKALEISASDMVLFFDNDMTFTGTTLAAYSEALDHYGVEHFYGGPVAPNYESIPPTWLNEYLPRSAKNFSLGTETIEIKTLEFLGGNHMVPRLQTLQNAKYDSDGTTGQRGLIGEEMRVQENLLLKNITGIYTPVALTFHYVPIDRCTPEWVLHRNYRAGFTAGIRNIQGKCTLFNVPCWVVRRMLSLSIKYLIGLMLQKENHMVFRMKYDMKYYSGIIDSKINPDQLPDAHWVKPR